MLSDHNIGNIRIFNRNYNFSIENMFSISHISLSLYFRSFFEEMSKSEKEKVFYKQEDV